MRVVSVAEVLVFDSFARSLYQLGYEKYDGSGCVVRNLEGISESMHKGEDPAEAAVRGLAEELEVDRATTDLLELGSKVEEKLSSSTGKLTRYIFYRYMISLSLKESLAVWLKIAGGIKETKGILHLKFIRNPEWVPFMVSEQDLLENIKSYHTGQSFVTESGLGDGNGCVHHICRCRETVFLAQWAYTSDSNLGEFCILDMQDNPGYFRNWQDFRQWIESLP